MKTSLLIYPHQLFKADELPQANTVFVIEEPLYFGTDIEHPLHLHRQKLVLHRASMRRYVEEVLWPAGYEVEYVEFHDIDNSADIFSRVKHFDHVSVFEPVNEVLLKRLQKASHDMQEGPVFEVLVTPGFYLKRGDAVSYFSEHKQHNFTDFYQWQRERFNILIDENYHPVGGDWQMEGLRGRVPVDTLLPTFEVFGDNKFVDEARLYVDKNFPDNQSDYSDFPWPTSHSEAAAWLDDFVEHRLDGYAPYQDAIDSNAPWLFHSALASSLNTGLLNPRQIVDRALQRHKKRPVDLTSLENFIRQVLGSREYARATYESAPAASHAGGFKHTRHLTPEWYSGTTGLPPLDNAIKKVAARAYVHHAERQMVLGTMLLLAEINPDEVAKFFHELFVDTYDWVPVPNVTDLSKSLDGEKTLDATFPCSSSYLIQMSNYEQGDWTDTWDGLYWRFIEKHLDALAKHPFMAFEIEALGKLDPAYKRIIGYRADDFLNANTRA